MRNQIPLLKQWDERWGDYPYSSSTIAASGCAPTCFAMVAQFYGIHITPPEAADFAIINSFYPTPGGTNWNFFAAAGHFFGIPMIQTADPNEVLAALHQGIPGIGVHGSGEFTQSNHCIVYARMTEGNEVMVHDPNRNDTCKLYHWNFLVQDNSNTGYMAFIPSPKILSKHS